MANNNEHINKLYRVCIPCLPWFSVTMLVEITSEFFLTFMCLRSALEINQRMYSGYLAPIVRMLLCSALRSGIK